MRMIDELGISKWPWKANAKYGEVISTCDGFTVVSNCNTIGILRFAESDANVRLIAAAPELYECLREAIVGRCNFCTASEDDRRELCDQCMVAQWKEAIAKASGEEVK